MSQFGNRRFRVRRIGARFGNPRAVPLLACRGLPNPHLHFAVNVANEVQSNSSIALSIALSFTLTVAVPQPIPFVHFYLQCLSSSSS